jgi:uncharacterized protein YutD
MMVNFSALGFQSNERFNKTEFTFDYTDVEENLDENVDDTSYDDLHLEDTSLL